MGGVFSRLLELWTIRRDNAAGGPLAGGSDLLDEFEAGRAIPEDLVDAILDDEIPEARRGEVFAALRAEPEVYAELDESERVLDAMRESQSLRSPDLTGRILGEVHRRKGLLDVRGLRQVSAARWSIAIALVATAAGYFTLRRAAPDAMELTPVSAPLRDLARALPVETNGAILNAKSALDMVSFNSARLEMSEPVCSKKSRARCDAPCKISCGLAFAVPIADRRLAVESWLEAVEEISAYALIPSAQPKAAPSVTTMPAAWTPGSARMQSEGAVFSVRALMTEPTRRAEPEDEAERLFPEPRR